MSATILVTHRIFPETAALLRPLGDVRVPDVERFDEGGLRALLPSARAAMIFMPDRVDARFDQPRHNCRSWRRRSRASIISMSTPARIAASG